jgi:replication factor C subunit 1
MDIRNFFTAKKPPNKKKLATVDNASSVDNNDQKLKSKNQNKRASFSSSHNVAKLSPNKASNSVKNDLVHKKKIKDSSTKKRRIIIDDEEEEEEISATDFFAQSRQQRDSKKKASNFSGATTAISESPAKKSKSSPKVKEESKKLKETSHKKNPQKKRFRDAFDSDSFDDEDFERATGRIEIAEDEEEFNPSPVKSKKRVVKSPSPPKKARKPPSSTSKSSAKETIEILEPSLERDSFDLDSVKVQEFMAGLTFVFTGLMEGLNRDDAADLVKTLGGRVTSQISGKTSYLVIGEKLEDGRPFEEGSKYRKATMEFKDKTKLVLGEKKFYGLLHMYHEKGMKEKGIDPTRIEMKEEVKPSVSKVSSSSSTPASTTVALNPYAKTLVNPYNTSKNPYAKAASKPATVTTNPYAKATSLSTNPHTKTGRGSDASNPYAKSSTSSSTNGNALSMPEGSNERNDLWVDRYKPTHTRDILGNKVHVTKLQNWLKTWERTFLNSKAGKTAFSNPKGPWKAALLSGPPGIGSTSWDCS